MSSPKITVVGSINMDLVTETSIIPDQGMTILGDKFSTMPGGKGANQAIAAARLGAEVRMIGCVGDDSFGKTVMENLKNEGILVDSVEPVTDYFTGIANIMIYEQDNRIIVVPGANYRLTPEMIETHKADIAISDVVLIQLEIPYKTVEATVDLAHQYGVKIVLNPAPARKLPETLLNKINYLTPNEYELAEMLGVEGKTSIQKLMQQAGSHYIVTNGKNGVYYLENQDPVHVPGYDVSAVDTTGAGDTFNGAFAVAISAGWSLKQACKFANAAGALSVTKFGAQTGMPTLPEVKQFLNDEGVTDLI